MRTAHRTCTLALLFAACGASQQPGAASSSPSTETLPSIQGRAIYDRPLAAAPEPFRALYASTSSLLAQSAPTPPSDTAAYRAWMHDTLAPWMHTQVAGINALTPQLERVRLLGPREALAAAVLEATTIWQFAVQLRAMPPPADVAANPDTSSAYESALEERLEPLLRRAQQAYASCASLARQSTPPLDAWTQPCESAERAISHRIGPIVPPTASASPQPTTATASAAPQPPLPPECDENEPGQVEPLAPPADRHAPREVVLLVDEAGLLIDGSHREALLTAVAAALRARHMRVVPINDVIHAEHLAGERRWTDGGPVCGQSPPVPAVLAPRHPNMLVGYVSTQRSTPVDPDTALSAHPRVIGPEAFTLEVGFAHASPSDTGPMPDQLEAQVTPRGADAEPWLAAAARLRPSPAAYGGLIGSGAGESNDRYFLVSGASSIDPWLRVARTVQSDAAEQAFAQCHAGPHVATFAARWTIAPDGRVIDAAAEPMTRDGGDAGAEAGCVRDALQALAFPCTRSGQPATVSVRICIGRHRWR